LQSLQTKIKDLDLEVYNLNTVVVGSGAAGLTLAVKLAAEFPKKKI
jgi:aspartate oxidase